MNKTKESCYSQDCRLEGLLCCFLTVLLHTSGGKRHLEFPAVLPQSWRKAPQMNPAEWGSENAKHWFKLGFRGRLPRITGRLWVLWGHTRDWDLELVNQHQGLCVYVRSWKDDMIPDCSHDYRSLLPWGMGSNVETIILHLGEATIGTLEHFYWILKLISQEISMWKYQLFHMQHPSLTKGDWNEGLLQWHSCWRTLRVLCFHLSI